MKIVLAHKFFHLTGGTEEYFRNLSIILESHGHQTIPFAIQHPNNPTSSFDKYFLKNIDYREPSLFYRLRNTPRILSRTLYSWEARRKMEMLIRDTTPDIAHIQSIEHHISPSILHSFRAHNIPIVQSVNSYKLVCASYRLYLFDQQEICERCLYGKHYHALLTRCVKGSLLGSSLAMVEMYLHTWLKMYHLVDRFIVANRFVETKLLEAGYPARKIVKLLNPLHLAEYPVSDGFDDFILYFGRIDYEKGVLSLVKAMKRLPKLKLIVVGSGSQVGEIEQWIKDNGIGNVELVGPRWGIDLMPYLSRARLVVVPSIWYEMSPMVIYQAFASSKPVIGANIGGIPELLTEETGVLFEAGNVEDLANKIELLAFDDSKLHAMGRAARHWAEVNLDPERYYNSLMQVYQELVSERA